ncbi:MAG TPA: hypothetical protein DD435_11455 [Cyanobacteria bacterium UBA8530]|nr:hypothetical protein [Cyanobacteria bacterium UBA8530]
MSERFERPFLLSFTLHALLLLLFLAAPVLKEPPPLPPMEITMVEGPVGDGGSGEKFRPKKTVLAAPQMARAPRRSADLNIPRSRVKKISKEAPVAPREEAVDIQAALRERLKSAHQEEAARASQIGLTQSGAKEGNPDSQGSTKGADPGVGAVSGDGTGMSGQLAARGITRKVLPSYPDWAEKKWVEGDVRLRLWVGPEGEVLKVAVIGYSGTRDFDQRAVSALKQWRFTPLSASDGEQTGEITIQYRLGQ